MATLKSVGPARAEDAEAEIVVAVARLLAGMLVAAVPPAARDVSPLQLRVLLEAAEGHPVTLRAISQLLEVHPSNATRVVERLVRLGLLHRQDDPADRRSIRLGLTTGGRAVIQALQETQRTAFGQVLTRMPDEHRAALVAGLRSFAEAAGDPRLTGLTGGGALTAEECDERRCQGGSGLR